MSDTRLPDATTELVRGVLELIGTPRDDSHYRQNEQTVFVLCESALNVCAVVVKAQAAHIARRCTVLDHRVPR